MSADQRRLAMGLFHRGTFWPAGTAAGEMPSGVPHEITNPHAWDYSEVVDDTGEEERSDLPSGGVVEPQGDIGVTLAAGEDVTPAGRTSYPDPAGGDHGGKVTATPSPAKPGKAAKAAGRGGR